MRDPLFQIEGATDSALAELWRQAFFFQVVEVRLDAAVEETLLRTESERLERLHQTEQSVPMGQRTIEETARGHLPRVRAQLNLSTGDQSPLPLLVERRLGRGGLLFFSSGISSDWTTLAQSNAVIFWDRLTRELIGRTLPHWTHEAGQLANLEVPIPGDLAEKTSQSEWLLTPPSGPTRQLTPMPTARHQANAGQTVTAPLLVAGIHTLTPANRVDESEDHHVFSVAVNGSQQESDLRRLDPARWRAWTQLVPWEVIPSGQPVLWDAEVQSGHRLGRTLAGLALLCLGLEMLIVALWGRGFTWLRRREPA